MKKILIVDDEEQIVDWLFEMFKSEAQLELDVYKAYSGSEALDWLNKTKMDIVVSDICMPGLSGLQLMEIIKTNWPDCRLIFLTGHDEFEYVYSAIKYDGVKYLLKMENDNEILKAVRNTLEEIEKELIFQEAVSKAQQQMSTLTPLLQRDLLQDLLDGECPVSNLSVEKMKEINIPLDFSYPLFILLGQLDQIPANSDLLEKSNLMQSFSTYSSKYLSSFMTTACIVYERSKLVVLAQIKEIGERYRNEQEVSKFWQRAYVYSKGAIESIQSSCEKVLNVSVSFAVDSSPCMWQAIPERFSRLKRMLNSKTGSGEALILTEGSFSAQLPPESDRIGSMADSLSHLGKKVALETYLERSQQNDFMSLFTNTLEPLRNVKDKGSLEAAEVYSSLALTLLSHLNRTGLDTVISNDLRMDLLFNPTGHASWNDAVEYLYQMADLIFLHQKDEQKRKADDTIAYLKKYILNNLDKDLSLYKLSEAVYMSPVYISRFFKQETGSNLSDFIIHARIEQAKALLQNPALKIHEIAMRAGCSSPNYFARFFKKITGISPQQYRDHTLIMAK